MSAVRVRFVRTGGFANVRLTTEVDDPDEAERLSEAVRRSIDSPVGRARDGFVYEFTVETTNTVETYDLAEAQVDTDLRPMLRALVQRARPDR